MEPIISKLQEGVKYPRFERDATTIINDLVEHITKERGVYSSSIEPNPNEHKVWFNTNNNTLNIYENSRWNTISGQGGGSGTISGDLSNITSINMNSGTISGVQSLYISPGGSINIQGAAINGGNIGGATITGATISRATIQYSTLTGSTEIIGYVNASGATIRYATISGGTISGATISGGYINNAYINASGAYMQSISITNGNIGGSILLTGTINGGTISGATMRDGTLIGTINATNATISGGNIDINKIKAKSIETPLLELTSGSVSKSININGDNYIFYGKLADTTLFHSIDLNSGSINGLTSIKTLSYTGLTIEPYDATGTGTPIKIYGMAAGVHLYGVASLNWQKGTSYGYSMTFNTNNNIINSNFDSFNISNGSVTLTGGTISGSINASGLTISNASLDNPTLNNVNITSGNIGGIRDISMNSGNISGVNSININNGGSINASYASINNATINGGNLSGSISASGANINSPAFTGNVIIKSGAYLTYAGNTILTYTGSISNPVLMPYGGNLGYPTSQFKICGVTLTGGDFQKLKNLQ